MRISKILPGIIPATLLLDAKLASGSQSSVTSPPFPHLVTFSVLAVGVFLPLLIGSIVASKRRVFNEPEPSPGLGWQSSPGLQDEPEPSPGLGWQSSPGLQDEPEPSPGLGWQ